MRGFIKPAWGGVERVGRSRGFVHVGVASFPWISINDISDPLVLCVV